MSVPTPETRQGNSPDSPQVLSLRKTITKQGTHCTAQGLPLCPHGWVFPQMGIRRQDGGWQMMQTCFLLFLFLTSNMGFGRQILPRTKTIQFKQILHNTPTENDQSISPFSQVHIGAMIVFQENVYSRQVALATLLKATSQALINILGLQACNQYLHMGEWLLS